MDARIIMLTSGKWQVHVTPDDSQVEFFLGLSVQPLIARMVGAMLVVEVNHENMDET